ncbi:MAG TPA: DUF2314 domain-containing protein [Chthoniobacterales bacterium]|jgi:uncharacterized protein YegJ (DUF2314 family)|nr:DUF2314 domain-containing protein [Chthoniobacterales bacterium]
MLTLTQINQPVVAAAALFAAITLPVHADSPTASQPETNGTSEPQSYRVPNQHAAMHEAVTKARKTVRKFIDALERPTPGETDFEVKKPFVQKGEIEHIWLSDVKLIGGRFQGKVDNVPAKITSLKLGQVVSVNPNEISDWVYFNNGKLVGGYTIRAHYNELTPKQKKEFDRSADFRME